MKVLIAEDDRHTRQGLAEILAGEGYAVITAQDGREALTLFEQQAPDFVCLDIMLPVRNGYDLCREMRKHSPHMPIIFISAKSEEIDKVVGLELGADDFIVKPFGVREVIARVRAVTRRCLASKSADAARGSAADTQSFTLGDLTVLPAQLRAQRGKTVIELSLRDVAILRLLAGNQGRVLDRNALYNECWGVDYFPNSRALDQYISQLRKRIERDPRRPEIIRTVHGAGYRYDG